MHVARMWPCSPRPVNFESHLDVSACPITSDPRRPAFVLLGTRHSRAGARMERHRCVPRLCLPLPPRTTTQKHGCGRHVGGANLVPFRHCTVTHSPPPSPRVVAACTPSTCACPRRATGHRATRGLHVTGSCGAATRKPLACVWTTMPVDVTVVCHGMASHCLHVVGAHPTLAACFPGLAAIAERPVDPLLPLDPTHTFP